QRFRDGGAMAEALAAIPARELRGAPVAAPPPAAPIVEPTAPTSAMRTSVARQGTAPTALAPPPPRDRYKKRRAGRRWLIALVAVLVAVVGLVLILTGGSSNTAVPSLRGLERAAAVKRVHDRHLHVAFSSRFSDSARKGTVIAQRPSPGS